MVREVSCSLFPPAEPKEQELPLLQDLWPLVFRYLAPYRQDGAANLVCRRFHVLIEKRRDRYFILSHLFNQSRIIDEFTRHSSTRAAQFVHHLCRLFTQKLEVQHQLNFLHPVLQQWDVYRVTKKGMDPRPFLSAIYNCQECPKGMRLCLSQPTRLYPDDELILEHNNAPSRQKEDKVAICYQASSFEKACVLEGKVVKVKKNQTYEVEFRTSQGEDVSYIFSSTQLGDVSLFTSQA